MNRPDYSVENIRRIAAALEAHADQDSRWNPLLGFICRIMRWNWYWYRRDGRRHLRIGPD